MRDPGLSRVAGEEVSDKATFKQRPEKIESGSHINYLAGKKLTMQRE